MQNLCSKKDRNDTRQKYVKHDVEICFYIAMFMQQSENRKNMKQKENKYDCEICFYVLTFMQQFED